MEELFQKLMEAEILTEETKSELQEAINAKLEEAVATAKAEANETVRAELTEQWVDQRANLIEAIDNKVGEYLTEEVSELREDISRFRDLEAEYAERLVEEKENMKAQLETDLSTLVEKLDSFIEIRLHAEFEELQEDMAEVKKLEFGRKVFESFMDEFAANYAAEGSTEADLKAAAKELKATRRKLRESEQAMDKIVREAKMAELLQPLTGKSKEVMEMLLKNLATDQLDEGYKTFVGRVLRESTEELTEKEKEDEVLAESSTEEKTIKETVEKSGVIITGDKEPKAEETLEETVESDYVRQMKKLGGVIK